jgi:hypothetical protein
VLLLSVVMSCWALEGEEHNNWAAKEEVSKKQKQREDVPVGQAGSIWRRGRGNRPWDAVQLSTKKTELGTNKEQ